MSRKTLNAYEIQQLIDKKIVYYTKIIQSYKVLLDLTCKVIPYCHQTFPCNIRQNYILFILDLICFYFLHLQMIDYDFLH